MNAQLSGHERSTVPLVDLIWQHNEVRSEVEEGFGRVLAEGDFVLGAEVAEFEAAFAAFMGVDYCVGVANGTDALELALRACGVGANREVILPANTFVATAAAVCRLGAHPVLVDCDPVTHLIDVQGAHDALSPNTAAVIPVHLFGQMAPIDELCEQLSDGSIVVIEDAAQAHGALCRGYGPAQIATCAATSFYPGKNLGAYGDGGAVLTRSREIRDAIIRLRNYGSETKYAHPVIGYNSRLDTLQAVVLNAKLRRLGRWNDLRSEAAARYDRLLAGQNGVQLPVVRTGNHHVWHLYVIRVADRDRVYSSMRQAGIEVGIHYPLPIHMHNAFAFLGYASGAFPNAERAAKEVISLPIFPGISSDQQERVCDVLLGSLG